ncbi:hypothetical protein JRO89_XS06G0067200 [Xanthoceras sorbifolium]|uniref:F-box domain-containing protein n=1 Tax=Xanthoceras sorbifolium TaxID=99658 RepID=A0ABQ8HX59_9ROSI|nr:hypothetical protein JRO89_XS06G0067200 [Xanthoceras sorbifolium]
MSAIPLDLIVEILCQLPVKSLLRFRCLSKEFRSIIDDPDFIRRHHNACLETNSNRRIIATNNARTTLFSLDLDSAGDVVAAAKLPDLPIQNWRYGLTSIIGSCHGLLALSSHNHLCQITEVLWNISTNKLRILPRIPGEYSLDFIGGFGFGYDVASDDYKLVRIFWNQSSTKFIVYSLRANSWRWIEDLPDYNSFYIFCQGCGILVAGTLHWLWEREIDSREFIISFDLKSEKFYSVPMPDIASTTVDNSRVIRHNMKKGKDEIVEGERRTSNKDNIKISAKITPVSTSWFYPVEWDLSPDLMDPDPDPRDILH